MPVFKWILILVLLTALTLLGYAGTIIYRYQQSDDEVVLQLKEDYLRSIIGNSARREWPNIILIVFDDLGYGDFGSFGAAAIESPNIDRLAAGGTRFTQYYSPSPACSPSRAGLLTGRYPPRAGVPHVLFPEQHPISMLQMVTGNNVRIPAEEILLPEILQLSGFNTGMVGKWHLGDRSPSLPNDLGIDQFFGALYSNSMKPFALYRNERIEVEAPADQERLNERYTREAVGFIESQEDSPFFLYYAHNFPHVPLYSSTEQRGQSRAGLYGDVVEDLDRSVGEVVAALDRKGVLDNTLIMITSDNGPWYQGDPGDRRGRKNQTWEGGMRVPFIAHWPEKIPAGGQQGTPFSGVDILPTLLAMLGIELPADRELDGRDVTVLFTGEGDLAPAPLYYYNGDNLEGVRVARFKYLRERGVRAADFGDRLSMRTAKGPWLFDLSLDPGENYDVSTKYPEVMQRLAALLNERDAEMKRNPRGWR